MISPKHALITGASSGIGKELARLFAKDGYQLTLVARDIPRLEHVQAELHTDFQVPVAILAADLSTIDGRESVMNHLRRMPIDALVNNAGFGLYGVFDEISLEQQREMINVNILALTEFCHAVIPGMKQRGTGAILNIASTAAFLPGPLMSVYYATKAYVLSFSEALQNELAGTGVRISVLCPGPTATSFADRAGLGTSKLFQGSVMDVKRVAEEGYRGMIDGKTLVVPGFKNRLLTNLVRFIPRWIVPRLVRKAQERR